ncbi:hypothetical protein [Alkalihalobacillus pseudalcaliphilus]|uniref:hypothetical protein n=1 Tax=Alkalihalobacillus pseudalcaliphilus TaxID=79884 RepID=UPI00064E0642|nr:hypothetical protein [Alkalihalobacillus pseudalcaliphilus]KMK78087.1 hypothetical protein AB990_01150 [Alkalihalobacillus pseudalcaliphilus]
MFQKKGNTVNGIAEILLAGQSLSFKLTESETRALIEDLESVDYDFKKLSAIKTYHPDGQLKSIINPLHIARIWMT